MAIRLSVILVILILTQVAHLSNEQNVGQQDDNNTNKIFEWIPTEEERQIVCVEFENFRMEARYCPRIYKPNNRVIEVLCKGDSCPEDPYFINEWPKFDGCHPECKRSAVVSSPSTRITTTMSPNVDTNEPPKCTNDSNSTTTVFLIVPWVLLLVVIPLTAVVTRLYPQHCIIQIISFSFRRGRNGNTGENIGAGHQRAEQQQQQAESSMDDEEETTDNDLCRNAVDKLLCRGSNQKSETRTSIGSIHGQPEDDVALSIRTDQ